MGISESPKRTTNPTTSKHTRGTKSESSKAAIVEVPSQSSCLDVECSSNKPRRHVAKTEGAKPSEDESSSQALSTSIQGVPAQREDIVSPSVIPRGLQVKSYDANVLSKGFPYPKVLLLASGITKRDWKTFQAALVVPLKSWVDTASGERLGDGVGYEVDNILDIVAEWDQKFFRKHGFLMRLDMPGEEKYGLDTMDLYYEGKGNRKTFNVEIGKVGKFEKGKMKVEEPKVLLRAREKLFHNTRVVLDPLSILDSPKLYEQRGWSQWEKQCAAAKRALLTTGAGKLNIEPMDFNTLKSQRVDRWPLSKHLYYDRWRCKRTRIVTKSHNGRASYTTFYVPDHDSMDQRGNPESSSVFSCDELPRGTILAKVLADSHAGGGGHGLSGMASHAIEHAKGKSILDRHH